MATRRRFNGFDSDDDCVPDAEDKKVTSAVQCKEETTFAVQPNEKRKPAQTSAQEKEPAVQPTKPAVEEEVLHVEEERLVSELPELSQVEEKVRRKFLFRPMIVSKIRDAFAKDQCCILVAGASGMGKSHAIEEALKGEDLLTELHVDAEDSKPIERLLQLSLSTKSTLRAKTSVLIENIDGLDSEDKKRISNFVKKQHSQCRLILTCDSLQESPPKTIKEHCTVVSLMAYSVEELQDLTVDYAWHTFQVSIKPSQVEVLCNNARGNPRACFTAFDWSFRTKKAKKGTGASKQDLRDLSMDLFSQVPTVLQGRPMKVHLESSDAYFCLLLLFENTCRYITKDHLSSLEISASRFLMDLESTQVSMETIFKAQHDTQSLSKFLKMPGPTKPKMVSEAAWWPLNEDCPLSKPSGLDAADRLSAIRACTAKLKSLTSKSPQQHEMADVRELRRKSPFV